MSNVITGAGKHETAADADTVLGRDAVNAVERRATLQWCLDNVWANKDFGRIERLDMKTFHGWRSWRWKKRE